MVRRNGRVLLGRQQRQGSEGTAGVRSRSARRARVRALYPINARYGVAGSLPQISRADRRAVRIPGIPHGAAGERLHHGCEGRHGGHGAEPDGVGGDRQTQPARVGGWGAGRHSYAKNDGLFPSGYHLFRGEASEGLRAAIAANEKARLAAAAAEHKTGNPNHEKAFDKARLWKGWILPASDADVWFVAGAAAYYRDLKPDDPELEMNVQRAAYRRLQIAAAPEERHWLEITKGVLFLDALRRRMGDDAFLKLMRRRNAS